MLSTTTEHALRAVLFLASRPAELISAREIAAATGAPANYMAKTLNELAHKGVVRSVRGPRGGFALAVSPSDLSLADLVAHFAPPSVASRCLMADRPCNPASPCAAHSLWTEVSAASRRPLGSVSVADLLAGRSLSSTS